MGASISIPVSGNFVKLHLRKFMTFFLKKVIFFCQCCPGKTWNYFLQERHFSSILFLFCRAHSSAHSCVDSWYKNFPTIFYEFFNSWKYPFFGRHVITFHRSSFKTYPDTGLEIKKPPLSNAEKIILIALISKKISPFQYYRC